MSIREDEIKELKRTGGYVYAFEGETNISWGITRRDWLAGLAMQGLCSGDAMALEHHIPGQACRAYELADAMIAEGNK